MDAVNAMDKKIQVQAASSGDKSSFFNLDKFKGVKEALTTMMTTMATDAPTTPSYGQDGSSYPKYFFANMSGSDDGYNGNLFPMEVDAWYQPGKSSYPSSYQNQYSRPRPRPRPRPRLRPAGYRRYGATRPAVQPAMQPPKPMQPMKRPLFSKPRFSVRSLEEEEPDHVDDAYVSLIEPLRPAIRQFLHIAREEQELLDNDLGDYAFVDYPDEELESAESRLPRSPTSKQPKIPHSSRPVSPNTHRYAKPTN
jgi:hypothetical protein